MAWAYVHLTDRMRKPKPQPPRHSIEKIGGAMPVTICSAGPGQKGGGYLVFHETWVEVVLKPESAWKQATKAKRKASNKLTRPDGTWNVWFLLSRAYVLSQESIREADRELGPADTLTQAANQLRSAGKARARAADARIHAILEAGAIGESVPCDVASSDADFISWFEEQMELRSEAKDREFLECVNGYVRAAQGLQDGYPDDVMQLSRALAEQAALFGAPPTKESVRVALGEIEAARLNKAEAIQHQHPEKRDGFRQTGVAADLIDRNTFTRLLNRTGFSWLPNGKTGPRRRDTEGKGRSVEASEYHLPSRNKRRPPA